MLSLQQIDGGDIEDDYISFDDKRYKVDIELIDLDIKPLRKLLANERRLTCAEMCLKTRPQLAAQYTSHCYLFNNNTNL